MTQEEFESLKIGDVIVACTEEKYVIVEIVSKGTYKVRNLNRNNVAGSAFIACNWTLDKTTYQVCI